MEGPHVLRPGTRSAPGEKACLPKPEERRGGDRGPARASISGCLSAEAPRSVGQPNGARGLQSRGQGRHILQGQLGNELTPRSHVHLDNVTGFEDY